MSFISSASFIFSEEDDDFDAFETSEFIHEIKLKSSKNVLEDLEKAQRRAWMIEKIKALESLTKNE